MVDASQTPPGDVVPEAVPDTEKLDTKILDKIIADNAKLPRLSLAERITKIDLPDVYEGMNFTAWMNYPPAVRDAFQTRDVASRMWALKQIVRSTNFKDVDGNPFPAPSSDEFWKAIPDDLAVIMINAVIENMGRLTPTSAGK